jgi:hypothetical protein
MIITARYAGRCHICGGRIEPGDTIEFDGETQLPTHVECPEVARVAETPTTPPAAELADELRRLAEQIK